MADYDYGSPSPSPPPSDGHTDHLQQASISDLFLQLRRRANDGPADDHSRHRQQQQQQQMYVINMDHRIPPVREPDGTTRRYVIISNRPHCPEAATATSPRRHHRANTAATPYHRPEHHERWSNRRRRSRAPHEDDYEGATKVVCLAKMLWPGDRLEDDGFYRDFLEDVTKEGRKFGDLVKVVIPRPGPGIEGGGGAASVVAGVRKVFLVYTHLDDAAWCRKRLDGRWYSGKEITAAFFPQNRFAAGDYDYDG